MENRLPEANAVQSVSQNVKSNMGVIFATLLSAVNMGIAIQFWIAVFTPRQEYISDYTSLIYWLVGVPLAIIIFIYGIQCA